MPINSFRLTVVAAVVAVLFLAPVDGRAQNERTVQAAPADEDSAYDGKFFDQLRALFGRFRNSDLERAFQGANSIRCPELVSNRGEWRPVAFFNENRQLGDWYRATIEEVRSDLAVYVFKGSCSGDRSPLQLTTKFPIDESIDAFNAGRIPFERIDVNVNPPVSAVFDPRSEAYTFDLPFLFLRERHDTGNIYSLIAPRLSSAYAKEVTDHWDCKAVSGADVTYQFIICRTNLVDRDPVARNQRRTTSFGSSAFFILSDGKEATSSVKLSFGDGAETPITRPTPVDPPARPTTPARGPAPENSNPPSRREIGPATEPISSGIWRMPDFWSKVGDLTGRDFRLLFSPQTWTGKIGSPQLLADQRMLAPSAPPATDYCLWKPSASRAVERLLGADADAAIAYTALIQPKNAQTPPSVTFTMKTFVGSPVGELQCIFPRADTADTITFDRWINIVGAHVTLELAR